MNIVYSVLICTINFGAIKIYKIHKGVNLFSKVIWQTMIFENELYVHLFFAVDTYVQKINSKHQKITRWPSFKIVNFVFNVIFGGFLLRSLILIESFGLMEEREACFLKYDLRNAEFEMWTTQKEIVAQIDLTKRKR